jgi:Tol biopolymer transport system component
MLTYVAEGPPGQIDLYAARVSGGASVRLTNDLLREESPRFSPDGERIAYTFADANGMIPTVRIIPTLGGAPLTTIPQAFDAAWAPDGKHLAYLRRRADARGNELVVSSLDGSDARAVLSVDSRYPFLRHPAWSPDGNTIAIVRGSGGIAGEIWFVPSEGGSPRPALNEPESVFADWPSFTRDGQGVVHASNRGGATNIWLLPLGGGAPVQLTTGAGPDEWPTVSEDGSIAYVNSRWHNSLELHDLQHGTFKTLLTHSPYVWAPAISPDEQEVAFSRGDVDGAWHIWTVSLRDGAVRQLTSGDAGEVYPRYSRDGAFVSFYTWNHPRRIGRVPPIGGSLTWLKFGDDVPQTFADLSPNGETYAFVRTDPDAERIYTAALGSAARRLTSSRSTLPRWSPDGSLIAFASDRRYDGGISVIKADGTGERQISKVGGWPVWWPDGRQIAFIAAGQEGHGEIRVASLADGSTRTLTSVKLGVLNHPFAVFPDGQRLVVGNAIHEVDEVWVLDARR